MTVTTTNIQNVLLGNGATTVFPFTFRLTLASQVAVLIATGTAPAVTLNPSEYVVVQNAGGVGGYVQIYSSTPAVGTTVTIRRVMPLTQETSITSQGPFLPEAVMDALDRGVMQGQQAAFFIDRSLRVPDDALGPLPNRLNRAGRLLGFDVNGDPTVTTTVPDFDVPIDVATRAAEIAVEAAETATGARVDVSAAAAQTLAAANVAIPAAALAVALSNNFAEVVGPVTGTPESYFNTGGPYSLGDVLPIGAPFANERLAAVRLDLARGLGSTIDMGSVV